MHAPDFNGSIHASRQREGSYRFLLFCIGSACALGFIAGACFLIGGQ